ncbi:MAG: hypothetical protein KY444_05960, partial [Gemmatimonadetes bacterium]|nr:hypothetical protein [Gemmatimonadota bacterium]
MNEAGLDRLTVDEILSLHTNAVAAGERVSGDAGADEESEGLDAEVPAAATDRYRLARPAP